MSRLCLRQVLSILRKFFPRCRTMNSLWRGPREVATESAADVDGVKQITDAHVFQRCAFHECHLVRFEIPSCKLQWCPIRDNRSIQHLCDDDEDDEDGDAELLTGDHHQLTLRRRRLGHLRESRSTFSRSDGMTTLQVVRKR